VIEITRSIAGSNREIRTDTDVEIGGGSYLSEKKSRKARSQAKRHREYLGVSSRPSRNETSGLQIAAAIRGKTAMIKRFVILGRKL